MTTNTKKSKIDHLVALLILAGIYFLPQGREITSGEWIYVYKSSVSALCISLLLYFFGKNLVTVSLSAIEGVAILSNVTLLFTPIAHHFPAPIIGYMVLVYDNYQNLPTILFIAQLVILIMASFNGFYRAYKRYAANRSNSDRGGSSNNLKEAAA